MSALARTVFLAHLACPVLLAAAEPAPLKSEVLLDRLDNPCGIALRPPGGAELFVAESGAGRILRLRLGDKEQPSTAIEGFPVANLSSAPYRIGPLSVAFLDRTLLVVGEGGQAAGADVVRLYRLPDDGKTLRFDQSAQRLGPVAASAQSATGEGDFYSIATAPAALYVASQGDAAKGWILKADVANLTASQLKMFVATSSTASAGVPGAVATSKRGELVVAHVGDSGTMRETTLSFYNSRGKQLMKLDSGLQHITGLAYGQSGLLYATNLAPENASTGGVYRLDMEIRDGRQGIKAVKLAIAIARPAGLAIASNRLMYVTALGQVTGVPAADGERTGQLLKVEGEF